MRACLAQVVASISCLAGICLQAQGIQPAVVPCPAPHGHVIGELKLAQVNFVGANKLPIQAQEQVAHAIERKVLGSSVESVTNEAVDQAREAWQNRGYFKAATTSEGATLNSVPPQTVSLAIRVEEGPRYRLGEITFKNNRAVQNTEALRSLFPIKDGDILSREKIAKGLDNLRKAYTELGYINFTSIPNTTFNEEQRLGFLEIDVDEGMQFYVRSIEVVGVDQVTRDQVLQNAPLTRGQVYNSRLLELLIKRHPAVFRFAPDDPAHISRHLDEHAGIVDITIDMRVLAPKIEYTSAKCYSAARR